MHFATLLSSGSQCSFHCVERGLVHKWTDEHAIARRISDDQRLKNGKDAITQPIGYRFVDDQPP